MLLPEPQAADFGLRCRVMRIILDYLYANQLIGLLTTFALSTVILFVLFLEHKFNKGKKNRRGSKQLNWAVYMLSGLFFVFLIVQISWNPFGIGRAGIIHQYAILDDTIVFADSYAQSGAEFGDTPDMNRLWVIDKKTGRLLRRIKVNSYEPIVAANGALLLIQEGKELYLADSRLFLKKSLILHGEYEGKKIHDWKLSGGVLTLAFKDFSEVKLNTPFAEQQVPPPDATQLTFLDADHETYRVHRVEAGRSEERRVGKECSSRWSPNP